jgi:HPr kinase/phosphorylase
MSQPAQTESRYGVMVCIHGQGVLITGKPGTGKSSLALELVSQGHQLVADDVIEVSFSDNILFGHCPNMLMGLLHTRELGTIDIEALYGKPAIVESSPIQFVVELSDEEQDPSLEGRLQTTSILGTTLPLLTLSVTNPASVKTRLQTWLKLLQNADASEELKRRQQAQMQR